MLARHEQALQLSVLDHLREIEARRLYLRLGYSSLFDYTVHELHYTEASAWRRIKAMRLCRETRGVREWLQDGSLNLSNAALLQNSFERWDRSGAGPVAAGSSGSRNQRRAAPRLGSLGGEGRGGGCALARVGCSRPAAAGGASGGQEHPAGATDAGRVGSRGGGARRAVCARLGNGRWELRAVIDAECQRGLQQLRELLSHVDPHLTIGQLVGRLVREGVARYDPSRPRGRKRRESDPSDEERSSVTAGRETADRVAAAAANRRRAGNSAAPTRSPSAPKRSAKPAADGTSPATLPAGGGSGGDSPKRRLGPPPGSRTSATKLVAPATERAGGAVAPELTSAAKPRAWQQAVRFRFRAPTELDRRSGLRRRSLAWQPAVRLRIAAPPARDRRGGLRRRSPPDRPADRFRLRSSVRFGGAIRAAAPTSTGTPGGAAAHASSWRWTTSCRSRWAAVRRRGI